jgi:hypothetical protein
VGGPGCASVLVIGRTRPAMAAANRVRRLSIPTRDPIFPFWLSGSVTVQVRSDSLLPPPSRTRSFIATSVILAPAERCHRLVSMDSRQRRLLTLDRRERRQVASAPGTASAQNGNTAYDGCMAANARAKPGRASGRR